MGEGAVPAEKRRNVPATSTRMPKNPACLSIKKGWRFAPPLQYTSWLLLLKLEEELQREFHRTVAHGPGRETGRGPVRIRPAKGPIAPGYREVQVSVLVISIVIELFVGMVQPIESLHAELDGFALTDLEILED